jgi:hypothetical protein
MFVEWPNERIIAIRWALETVDQFHRTARQCDLKDRTRASGGGAIKTAAPDVGSIG